MCKQFHPYLLIRNFQPCSVVLYSFCSLSICTFCGQKVPKNSAHGKNLHKRPLLTPHIASPRSGACSSLQASACFQGAAELDLHGYTRKVIPAQIFKQSSHNGLKTSGLALDFSTVPFRLWRGITFAMKIYRNVSRTLTRTIVISKNFVYKIDNMCSDRSHAAQT